MNKNKENNFAKKRKYTLGCILAVLSIIIITVFAISASAENNTAGSEKEIADEKMLVRTTASLSRLSNEDEIVDKDTLAEQLNKYAGTGITSVTEKTSDKLTVTFLESGRQYYVEINTGMVYEKKYTITYNANGGSGAPATVEIENQGESITLSTEQPTLSNSIFLGWSTDSSAKSISYYPGDVVLVNDSFTLYAVWGHWLIQDGTIVNDSLTSSLVRYHTEDFEGSGVHEVEITVFELKEEENYPYVWVNYYFGSEYPYPEGEASLYLNGSHVITLNDSEFGDADRWYAGAYYEDNMWLNESFLLVGLFADNGSDDLEFTSSIFKLYDIFVAPCWSELMPTLQ